MDHPIRTAGVVGAGLVGCGWAVTFALAGVRVRVFDASLDARRSAHDRIRQMLDDMLAAGLADGTDAALSSIDVVGDLRDAVADADYVQECVFEEVGLKREVAAAIGAGIGAEAVVGSSSSGIPASAFTETLPNRGRFLVAHPVNPPHLIPLVELVPAPWTAPEIVPWLRARMGEMGKVAIEVRREVEGFVLNRLQGALLNEAWALFEEGYASAADIDATVSQGLGLRWAFMGPFETIDLNAPEGVADYARRYGPLYRAMAESRNDPRGWSPDLIARVADERRAALPANDIGRRSRWRDRRLMELLAHLRGTHGDS